MARAEAEDIGTLYSLHSAQKDAKEPVKIRVSHRLTLAITTLLLSIHIGHGQLAGIRRGGMVEKAKCCCWNPQFVCGSGCGYPKGVSHKDVDPSGKGNGHCISSFIFL